VKGFYQRLGREEPQVIWLDGPASAVMLTPLLIAAKQLYSQLGEQLYSQMYSQLSSQLDEQLSSQLSSQLYSQLDEQLSSQLYSQLSSQLYSQLDEQLSSLLRSQLNEQLSSQLDGQLYSQLSSLLRSQLNEQLSSQLSSQLYSQLDEQLSSLLRSQLYSQLSSQLYSQLDEQLSSQLGEPQKKVWACRYWGAEYCWWIAYHVVARDIVGATYMPEQSTLLDEWAALAQSCGWWFPLEGVAVLTERHRQLHFDELHRLHCSSGPAIECRDSYRVYAWHGIRVPAEWIEHPEKLTAKEALSAENLERRRAACEIIGWHRILEEVGAIVIDEHQSPYMGALLDAPKLDAPDTRYLRVKCGTGRTFVLRVPATCSTVLDAQAWCYDCPSEQIEASEGRT